MDFKETKAELEKSLSDNQPTVTISKAAACQALAAVEKQIRRRPKDIYDDNVGLEDSSSYEEALIGYCPRCNLEVQDGMNFCSSCGQKLGWEDHI